jgi:hypothetical protein
MRVVNGCGTSLRKPKAKKPFGDVDVDGGIIFRWI